MYKRLYYVSSSLKTSEPPSEITKCKHRKKKTCLVYILKINDHVNRHTLLTQLMLLTWAHQLGRKHNIKQTFLNISVCSFKWSSHWRSLFIYYHLWVNKRPSLPAYQNYSPYGIQQSSDRIHQSHITWH